MKTISFKDRKFLLFFACFMLVLLRYNASAATLQTRSLCDRNFNVNSLKSDIIARLNKGETVILKNSNTDSGFDMLYGFHFLKADAALAMGVASSFEEHSKHISVMKEATVLERKKNYAKVRFEILVDNFLIPNSYFTSNIYVVRNGTGYLQFWNLNSSTGLSRPIFADGYVRMDPMADGGALMVYCTYSVPSMQISVSLANSLMHEGITSSLKDTVSWIEAANANQTRHKKYTDFLFQILK